MTALNILAVFLMFIFTGCYCTYKFFCQNPKQNTQEEKVEIEMGQTVMEESAYIPNLSLDGNEIKR